MSQVIPGPRSNVMAMRQALLCGSVVCKGE